VQSNQLLVDARRRRAGGQAEHAPGAVAGAGSNQGGNLGRHGTVYFGGVRKYLHGQLFAGHVHIVRMVQAVLFLKRGRAVPATEAMSTKW
jgi:hypothetical protein